MPIMHISRNILTYSHLNDKSKGRFLLVIGYGGWVTKPGSVWQQTGVGGRPAHLDCSFTSP